MLKSLFLILTLIAINTESVANLTQPWADVELSVLALLTEETTAMCCDYGYDKECSKGPGTMVVHTITPQHSRALSQKASKEKNEEN